MRVRRHMSHSRVFSRVARNLLSAVSSYTDTAVKGFPMLRTSPAKCALFGAVIVSLAACSAATEELNASNSAAATTAFPNDKTAYDYFIGKGFTNFQAAAIVGNLDQESGINPTISQENGGVGRGIAQWSKGGRWDSDPGDNLAAFAVKEGLPTSSLQVQLDFIWFELSTMPGYGLAKLRASVDVTSATTDFEADYEGCNIASECDFSSRLSFAKSILAAYGGTTTTPPPPPPVDAGSSASGTIHPKASSALCLAVAGNSTTNGSAVVVATCDGSASQSWAFQAGTLRVYGTKCLDVPSGNTANGTKLQIWDCSTGNTNQSWTDVGTQIQWTGKGKCLDLTNGTAASGNVLQTWACASGNTNQSW